MIYLILSAVSAFFGLSSGIGATTLLRPMLDAVSPLSQTSIALLCTMATLCAALVSAFFALSQPLPLHQDELILLAAGAAIGGVLGDLISSRFLSVLARPSAVFLQNALLFALIALPAVYFQTLSRTLQPLSVTRLASLPVALVVGLFASFLSFSAELLTLTAYFLLFDAEDDESSIAALTITLFSMAGKLVTILIRLRLQLPDADVLLWLLPGAIIGALFSMISVFQSHTLQRNQNMLRLSLFTTLLNMASAAM